ncbi:transcription factor HES-5-like [Discoglossus pictus]
MAPCNMQQQEEGASKHIRKLRKPVIEKMRRDRINSSIEQLRILLEKEFHKQQLPSKPEKADILEMTVSFLQQHMAGKYMATSNQAHTEGYSKCLQESVSFLKAQDQTQAQQWKLLRHFHSQQVSYHGATTSIPDQQAEGSSKALWRPW